MMVDLENITEYWYKSGFEAYNTFHSDETKLGNKAKAEDYLKKYGLFEQENSDGCQAIQESIFHLDRQLPDMIFKKDFEFISLLGGMMFEKKDFKQFKTCLMQLGEISFMVFQDTLGLEVGEINTSLKMQYPVDISWKELISGDYISTILFDAFYNHYYVFGKSGKWGMYSANEYIDKSVNPAGTPIRIIGFEPKYRTIFRTVFEIPDRKYSENVNYISEDERPNLKKWVPKLYRNW